MTKAELQLNTFESKLKTHVHKIVINAVNLGESIAYIEFSQLPLTNNLIMESSQRASIAYSLSKSVYIDCDVDLDCSTVAVSKGFTIDWS